MALELWACLLTRSLKEPEEDELLRLLPPARRERLLQVKVRERRREPLCAYALLRHALREQCGSDALPEIAISSSGKPFFPAFPKIQFNLSHTNGAVMAGLSDQPLGVDIEKIRPVGESAMRRLSGVTTERDFFRSWVRMEARAKQSGAGVSAMMRGEAPLETGECYYNLDTFDGYAAGLATRSLETPGELRRLTMDELL